jgi:hypothetical protein
MADVFLSYAREDRAKAAQIAEALTAGGYDVFWDVEIPPGVSWADFLQEKLSQCKAALVLWSATSTASQWVREEARLARDHAKLIPVMIDGSQPPFGFGEIHAANLSDWNGEENHVHWRLLLEGVARAVGTAPSASASAAPLPKTQSSGWDTSKASGVRAAAPVAPKSDSKRPPVWLLIGGAVVGTVLVLAVIGSMMDEGAGGTDPNQPQQVFVAPAPAPGQTAPLSAAIAADVPAQVSAMITRAREAQASGRLAADTAEAAAQQVNRLMLQAQQGAAAVESMQFDPVTTISGDLTALREGRAGAVALHNTQTNFRFSGLMELDASTGTVARMTGAADNGRGGQGLGQTRFAGTDAASAGRDTTAAYTAEGEAEGKSGTFETRGIGVVNYNDGRKYEGQYVTRGQDVHLLRHGLGATYAVNGDVLEAGRYENDRFVGTP